MVIINFFQKWGAGAKPLQKNFPLHAVRRAKQAVKPRVSGEPLTLPGQGINRRETLWIYNGVEGRSPSQKPPRPTAGGPKQVAKPRSFWGAINPAVGRE